MTSWLDTLRSGAWLTRERLRLVAMAVLAAALIGAGFLLATSNGLNDRFGRPLGTDFSNVYAAGTYVLDGEATAPFDPPRQYAREQAIFGAKTPFYGWHYPPFFLGLAALLALMPYTLALAVWQGATLLLYLLAMRAILCFTLPWQGEVEPPKATGWGARHRKTHPHPARSAPLAGGGEEKPLAAARRRLPGGVHQSRPRP